MIIACDLGVVCKIIAFHDGTETWRNLPDIFFPTSELRLITRDYGMSVVHS